MKIQNKQKKHKLFFLFIGRLLFSSLFFGKTNFLLRTKRNETRDKKWCCSCGYIIKDFSNLWALCRVSHWKQFLFLRCVWERVYMVWCNVVWFWGWDRIQYVDEYWRGGKKVEKEKIIKHWMMKLKNMNREGKNILHSAFYFIHKATWLEHEMRRKGWIKKSLVHHKSCDVI